MLNWEAMFEKCGGAKEQFEALNQKIPEIMTFDPKDEYAYGTEEHHSPMGFITNRIETGRTANLIRRMIDSGGTVEELSRALRHLRVCADAIIFDLNWKKSRKDNGVAELEQKYPKVFSGKEK